jgi:hypothetical protein
MIDFLTNPLAAAKHLNLPSPNTPMMRLGVSPMRHEFSGHGIDLLIQGVDLERVVLELSIQLIEPGINFSI